jgi:hypothetical protein
MGEEGPADAAVHPPAPAPAPRKEPWPSARLRAARRADGAEPRPRPVPRPPAPRKPPPPELWEGPAGVHRPPVEHEPDILGLSRHARSRLGNRAFTLFFVLVYGVILVQLIVSLVNP